MEILNYTYDELIGLVSRKYGKRAYHGDALFRHIYETGTLRPTADTRFARNLSLARELEQDFPLNLPVPDETVREERTVKFTLDLEGGGQCESVILSMSGHSTLCLSSQLGCRWNCRFCETGRMGFHRNLTTAEIMAQIMTARFAFGVDNLQNLVFMGMGEPFDNMESVLEAVDIASDSRGLNIPKRRISISTAGQIAGIRELNRLCREHPEGHYDTLHLCLSLHSADQNLRTRLMPITRSNPLDELRRALLDSPYAFRKDGLYIEYLIIPGVTDTPDQLEKIRKFLEGMEVKINLIPYNPGRDTSFRKPEKHEVDAFWREIRKYGYQCRTRRSKGESVMAACGQLGNRRQNNG